MASFETYESIDLNAFFELEPGFVDETMLEMIDESSPILLNSMRETLRGIIKEPNSGALQNLHYSKARKAKTGAYIAVAFAKGKTKHHYYNNGRKVPVYHDDALKWLEYGREGQPARPWVGKATRDAEKAVLQKLQSAFDSKLIK